MNKINNMNQLKLIFPDNSLPIKRKKLPKRLERSIMNFTTKRLLDKPFKSR